MNVLEEYLRELHEIRSSGSAVKETSYYPPRSNLLNAIGKGLTTASGYSEGHLRSL